MCDSGKNEQQLNFLSTVDITEQAHKEFSISYQIKKRSFSKLAGQ